MTASKFKAKLLRFLEDSTVNLGRKTTKTRQVFLSDISAILDSFLSSQEDMSEQTEKPKKDKKKKSKPNHMDDRLVCLKPKNKAIALNAGKGVHAMTPSESQRADEQLGRSPFSGKDQDGE
ncbi:hypothetical protein LCGC14_0142080 [marine sediment metagenome]|uniref:Uncharacterized protein n=1 Tax=marine sediment metagenome TaxID=412755 RepID=A0A0F9Y2S3_9ZZZZ